MKGKNMRNLKELSIKSIRHLFENGNTQFKFKLYNTQELLSKGYVITTLKLSNLIYDQNWNIIEGNIDANVTPIQDYLESSKGGNI